MPEEEYLESISAEAEANAEADARATLKFAILQGYIEGGGSNTQPVEKIVDSILQEIMKPEIRWAMEAVWGK